MAHRPDTDTETPPPPADASTPEDHDAAEDAAIAEGRSQIAAGHGISLDAVRRDMERARRDFPEDVAEMARDRWVRVMCDYGAEGLWTKLGCATGPDVLPITPELGLRLLLWQERYEVLFDWDAPQPTPAERASFSDEGLGIAMDLKRQLPDWTVIFHDERGHGDETFVQPRGAAPVPGRPAFEFEITPDMLAAKASDT